MAKLKPETNWSSEYVKVHPQFGEISAILNLVPRNISVKVEDKYREFEDISDLRQFWKRLHLPLHITFEDRETEYYSHSYLTLVVDDLGSVLIGYSRTPALVQLSDEIWRCLTAIKSGKHGRSRAVLPNELDGHRRTMDGQSFLQRNSDNLFVTIVGGLAVALFVYYFRLG
ncbi:hypothetical protein [Hyphomicrobium sp.]|uniref:hypothetical protein n=1 Tax=Hyphomicrobium sp. TaxID=82 RepID=UPI000FB722A6|nr:hypothetical protein [Hyphomicrobium sp.]RUP09563.1 MAG: hypothetical protein EKK38_09455 [Hyphomicrobium sp.]